MSIAHADTVEPWRDGQVPSDRAVPSDHYKKLTVEKVDKAALKALAQRMKVPDGWLRIDGCGTWHIAGPSGHVYSYSDFRRWLDGYLVVCQLGDGHRWAAIKKAMGGKVRQDGEDEGVILVGKSEVNIPATRRAIGCAR